jgi:hypothetical protein
MKTSCFEHDYFIIRRKCAIKQIFKTLLRLHKLTPQAFKENNKIIIQIYFK